MSLAAFEARFAVLDSIPESLFTAVATHTHGDLLSRAEGVLQWRAALLRGELPDEKSLVWPEASLRRVILMRLEVLDIVRYCRDQEELTDEILATILEGVASAEDYFSKAGAFDDRIAQQQKIRDRDSVFEDEDGIADHVDPAGGKGASNEPQGHPEGEGGGSMDEAEAGGDRGMSAETVDATLGEEGDGDSAMADAAPSDDLADADDGPNPESDEATFGGAPRILEETFDGRWGELAISWRELSPLLDELGGFLGRGWDLTQGVLSSQGWRDIARYRKLIRTLPELAKLVEVLGRMRGRAAGDAEGGVMEKITDPLKREPETAPKEKSPHAIDTTEGIKLSDDIARMLPIESAMLGHDTLNTLWHARRAESMLRCYQLQGVLSEHTPLPDPEPENQQEEKNEDPGHGPIIVCLDSSASMEGEPETIAKAVTLEALRIAAAENRDCFVISFSGEQQMISWQLEFSRQGYRDLVRFLQQSFHGGTDVDSALQAALEKLDENTWQQADVLLISDGRFPKPEFLIPKIEKAKNEHDVRIHGLLIGRLKSAAMEAICEPLHRYDVWDV